MLGGYHALTELSCHRRSWKNVDQKDESVSYASVTVQLLLRIPAVSVWLDWHRKRSAEQSCGKCAACVLWDSRMNFRDRSDQNSRSLWFRCSFSDAL